MNVARLLKLDGTLTSVTGTDSATDDHTPEVDTQDVAVKCWIEQVAASESTSAGDIQTDEWRIYLPAGTVVSGSDRLAVGDVELEVDGPPWPAINPRTAVASHVEAKGRRVR